MKFDFRFLIPVVGLTALSTVTLAANLGDMVSVSGHARTRYELNNNDGGKALSNPGKDLAYTQQALNRVRLNVDVSPAKPLMVRITPEFTGIYGDAATSNFTAHEAWMSWMANDMFSVIAGKQVLSYGKERIIGTNDWFQNSNTFDAARLVINHGYGKSDLVWAKGSGNNATFRHDNNMLLLYNAFTPSGLTYLKSADFYLAWMDDQGTVPAKVNGAVATGTTNEGLVGLRAAGDAGMINYDGEVAAEFGRINGHKKQKGMMVDAMAGVKLNVANVGVNVGYGNSEWTEVHPSNHEQLGRSDVITSRNNLINLGVMADGKINSKWTALAKGYYFLAAKSDAGMSAGGLAKPGSGRNLAIEGDFAVNYMPEKMINFDLGYDLFKGFSALKSAAVGTNDKLISKAYVQGTLTF